MGVMETENKKSGRPKTGRSREKDFHVYLNDSEFQKLKNISEVHGLSPSSFVRLMISQTKVEEVKF